MKTPTTESTCISMPLANIFLLAFVILVDLVHSTEYTIIIPKDHIICASHKIARKVESSRVTPFFKAFSHLLIPYIMANAVKKM